MAFTLTIFLATTCLGRISTDEVPISSQYASEGFYKKSSIFGTDKVSKTILKPTGIPDVSSLNFSCAKNGRFRMFKVEVIQPNGERIKLKKSQIVQRLTKMPLL